MSLLNHPLFRWLPGMMREDGARYLGEDVWVKLNADGSVVAYRQKNLPPDESDEATQILLHDVVNPKAPPVPWTGGQMTEDAQQMFAAERGLLATWRKNQDETRTRIKLWTKHLQEHLPTLTADVPIRWNMSFWGFLQPNVVRMTFQVVNSGVVVSLPEIDCETTSELTIDPNTPVEAVCYIVAAEAIRLCRQYRLR